jgi:hypothetical protein
MASINDVLLYQAQLDAANKEDNTDAAVVGAILGGSTGLAAGSAEKNIRDMPNRLRDVLAARQGLTPVKPPTGTAVKQAIQKNKPRFAGGTVGAVLGGLLGVAAKQYTNQESMAADLLAKRLAGEPLSDQEARAVQQVYSNTISNNVLG